MKRPVNFIKENHLFPLYYFFLSCILALFYSSFREAETSRPARIEQGKREGWRLSLPGPPSPAHTTTRSILMVSATITEIQGRDNCYSALLGVLGPSPSHGE